MGWVKAHLEDNHPATKLNERIDELTKIRKITLSGISLKNGYISL